MAYEQWKFRTQAFLTPAIDAPLVQIDYGDAWAACDECAELVRANNREKLEQRSFFQLLANLPAAAFHEELFPQLKAHIRIMHDDFFTHKLDDGVRLNPNS
jgi:hypothetical protein